MSKILTVVIPTYNMEKYLVKCLDSLIIPDMDKVEVLVINDGSKDNSSRIAHEYQEKYPDTFKVIDKENGNYGSCVNRGLSEATGKYIKILDADDSFDNASFEKYISVLQNLDVDLVFNDVIDVDPSDNELCKISINAQEDVVISDISSVGSYSMHQIAYKRVNLIELGYKQTEGISYTDNEWCFWPMVTVSIAYYIAVPLYRYLCGREGQTTAPTVYKKYFSQRLQVIKRLIFLWERNYESWKVLKVYPLLKECIQIEPFFYSCIINGDKELQQLFVDFDNEIRDTCPKYYQYSNTFSATKSINIPYLLIFRKTHSVVLIRTIYKVLGFMSRIKQRVISSAK